MSGRRHRMNVTRLVRRFGVGSAPLSCRAANLVPGPGTRKCAASRKRLPTGERQAPCDRTACESLGQLRSDPFAVLRQSPTCHSSFLSAFSRQLGDGFVAKCTNAT